MKKINWLKRYILSALLITLIFTQGISPQNPCEKLKDRPGNDDIIIMVDTSLSMIPLIDDIKDQLKEFFQCYIKKGDFVILGTFDSSCQIQFSLEISKLDRDFSLLLSQVDSLTPRRKIYYKKENKQWKESPHLTSLVGGGQFTNLGEMIQKVSEILKKYQTPGNRKFLLIYTDAINDPPSYIGKKKVELGDFFKDIKTEDIRLGLVACDEESYGRLQQLIRVIDESGEWQQSRQIEVMRNPKTVISRDLLGSDVWVEAPRNISLGTVWTPVIDTDIVLHNKLGIDANIKIKQIRAEIIDPSGEKIQIPLMETLKDITVKSQKQISFPIKKKLPRGMQGKYTGDVIFDIISAVRAVPNRIPIEYNQVSFCKSHKTICLIGLILAIVIGISALLVGGRILRQKLLPQWVSAYFTDSNGVDSAEQKEIARGEEIRVVGQTQAMEQTLNLKKYMGNDTIAVLTRKHIAKYELSDTHGNVKPYRLGEVVTMYREPGGFWNFNVVEGTNVERSTLQIVQAVRPIFKKEEGFFIIEEEGNKDPHSPGNGPDNA